MKLAFLDTETTGTDPQKNDIWQIGLILTVHGEVVAKECLECRPYDMKALDSGALAVGKTMDGQPLTADYLSKLPDPRTVLFRLLSILSNHVSRYHASDNFKIIGHNAAFDKDFLYNWFRKSGDRFFFSYFNKWALIDTLAYFRILYCLDRFVEKPANLQLGTICKYLGVPLSNAHNALADCEAVKVIWDKHIEPVFENLWLHKAAA